MQQEGAELPQPVLLFDGECGLCQACVRVLLRLDRRERLKFAPLQGAAAQAFLRGQGLPTEDHATLIFVPDWQRRQTRGAYLVRTDAVLAACAETGGVLERLAELRVLPRSWRDAGYRLVARVRYRLFGAPRPGALARPYWAERFL